MFLEQIQRLLHVGRYGNGIGAGFLVHQNPDRLEAVVARNFLAFGKAVHHGCNIAEAHQPECGIVLGVGVLLCRRFPCTANSLPRHHHIADLIDGLKLAQGAERVAVASAQNGSAAGRIVGVVERARDLGQGNPIRLEERRVHINLNLAVEATGDRRLRHPVELLQATAEDAIGNFLVLKKVGAPGQGDRQDRFGLRIDAQDRGTLGGLRKRLANVVEPFAHIEGGEIHVGAPRKAEGDQADPFLRDRGDLLDARHGCGLLFDRLGDQALDLGGRHIRIAGVDNQTRKADLGQKIDRQPRIGDDSQHDHCQNQHRHRDRGGASRCGESTWRGQFSCREPGSPLASSPVRSATTPAAS